MKSELREEKASLWVLAASPALWSVHFLLSYITAAVYCVKLAGPGGSLMPARVAIAVYTALALGGIGLVGWRGYKRHKMGGSEPPHDADTPEDRHRFLGFATLLLSGLSAVATLYSALAAAIIRSCQ